MPKILDRVMLSLEKITGLDWDDTSEEEWKDRLEKYIETRKNLNKKTKKVLKSDIEEMDDDEMFDDEEE